MKKAAEPPLKLSKKPGNFRAFSAFCDIMHLDDETVENIESITNYTKSITNYTYFDLLKF